MISRCSSSSYLILHRKIINRNISQTHKTYDGTIFRRQFSVLGKYTNKSSSIHFSPTPLNLTTAAASTHNNNNNNNYALKVIGLSSSSSSSSSYEIRRCIHKLPGASTRDMADLEDRLWSEIGTKVKDPELSIDLKTLGWMNRRLAVSEDGTVQILLRLPTLLHPSLEELKLLVQNAAKKEIANWAADKGITQIMGTNSKVNVGVVATKPLPWLVKTAEDQKELASRHGPGLANVTHCLAVYSCKGGVGKSTVAVNLAYEMARLGGRIGLLDVDVYGPSLPVLIKPQDIAVRRSPLGKGMVYPIEHEGVKVLSLGFVSAQSGVPGSGQNSGASVLRGPMAGKVVTQLIKGTDWGDLDVLILDLPPGTGDVQLTICQEVDLSGAVGVTTPSKLAIADAVKGIEMFESLDVPTIALVENMSYFECEGGGKHYPFGNGLQQQLSDEGASDATTTTTTTTTTSKPNSTISRLAKSEKICQFPLSYMANDANDSGIPLCLNRPAAASVELVAFERLAKIVSRELFQLPYNNKSSSSFGGNNSHLFVVFDDNNEKFELSSIELSSSGDSLIVRAFSEKGALQKRIEPEVLKKRDPRSGVKLEEDTENNDTTRKDGVTLYKAKKPVHKVVADRIEKKASVGYEVVWNDGSKYIYSRRAISVAAGGVILDS